MKFEIKKWLTGEVICTADIEASDNNSTSFKLGLAVRWAFGQKKDLRGADLQGADLRGADLQGADLRGAYLRGAYLQGADSTDKILLIGKRPILQIGMIGSRSDYLIGYNTDKGILIQAGCWTGTLEEFEVRIKKVHGESNYAKEYGAAVVFIKATLDIWKDEK